MAKVRTRPETGMLYLDFFYRGVRCREQTALPDTAQNRHRVQALMNRISKEIKQGLFNYATSFPGSPRAAQFANPPSHTIGLVHSPANAVPESLPDTPTLAEFSVTWRAEMAPQWRRLHANSVDALFDAHLLPAFGESSVSSITKADVLTFRARLAGMPGRAGKHLSPATINKTIGILRQCMTEASERFGLPDAFKGVKRLKARRPDVQPLSLEEVAAIRSTIRADYRNYVTVRLFTGMRTGEINGLKWKYVDFDKDLILVREVFSGGKTEENAKTESSLRDIPMLPMVKLALKQQWETRNPDSGFVFCSRDGTPVDAHNFANRIWYPLLRYLNIEKRRPYQTRHTAATLMLAAGENPEWIARVMGHTNTQMLFTVYSRYVPNLTRRDGLAIAGLLTRQQSGETITPPTRPNLSSLNRAELESMVRELTSANTKEFSHVE